MATFCDVALPVPLDRTFTYKLKNAGQQLPGQELPGQPRPDGDPPVGGRVIVPFRQAKLIGVVTRLHEEAPPVEARQVESILDREPILSSELMELGTWIAQYYLAPLGEVLRMMLPLTAEVGRHTLYRIAETGQATLFAGAGQGSSRRSRLTPEDQDVEYAVLNYLADGEPVKASALSQATGANRELLTNMVRKKWLTRESEAIGRDARRLLRHAVLVGDAQTSEFNPSSIQGSMRISWPFSPSLPVRGARCRSPSCAAWEFPYPRCKPWSSAAW